MPYDTHFSHLHSVSSKFVFCVPVVLFTFTLDNSGTYQGLVPAHYFCMVVIKHFTSVLHRTIVSEVPSFVLHYGSLLWTSQPPIHMTTGNLNDSGYSFKLYLLHYLYWIRRTFVLWLYSCPKLPTYYAHEICTYHFLVRMGRKGW